MKLAPNLKKQPRDRLTEIIIFAGSDAWSHAKEWQEWAGKHIAADDVPPVVLADEQLKNITDYRIIDEDRQCVRVYRAGHITEHSMTQIVTLLAVAGVKTVHEYAGITDTSPVDLSDQLPRLKEECERGESLVLNLPTKQKAQLSQMADSERAQLLAERFDGVCVHPESEIVHVWRGGVWCPISTMELSREMVAIYSEHRATFSKRVINNAVEALKVIAEPMGEPSGDLLPFANGALDLKTGEFSHKR